MFIVGTNISQGRHGECDFLAFPHLLNHLPDLSLRCYPAGDAITSDPSLSLPQVS